MKHEIFERPEISYAGLKLEIDLNNIQPQCIGQLWDELFKDSHLIKIDRTKECIGLEKYGPNFMEIKSFDYYALVPICEGSEINDKFEKVTLPTGKYIKFEGEFGELGKEFIMKAYDYVNSNNIDVDYSFDFELYPLDFDASNPKSKIYFTFKLK